MITGAFVGLELGNDEGKEVEGDWLGAIVGVLDGLVEGLMLGDDEG